MMGLEETGAHTDELEWLLEVSAEPPSDANCHLLLKQLLEASVEHLGCLTVAITGPNCRTLVAHGRGAGPHVREKLRQLEAPLLSNARSSLSPARLGPLGAQGTTSSGFRILAMPIASRLAPGTLVFVRAPGTLSFECAERHVARHLSQRAAALLEAQFDPATGLFTRTAMQAQIERWDAGISADATHAVICINIDRLHVVNETAGYLAGDRLIAAIARLMRPEQLPRNATAARIGGNEFAIVVPRTNVTAAENLALALQRHAAALASSLPEIGGPISLSCGIAPLADPWREFTHSLALAEVACNTARDRGGGRVEIYSEDDNSMVRRHADAMTLGRFREALRTDRLTLYAQQILPLREDGKHMGYELLLRDPDDPLCDKAPEWMFSAAQRYQMEPKIDLWVIEHALQALEPFRAELFEAQVSFSINVSGKSLTDEVLLERAKGWVRKSRIAPELIVFELTETAAAANTPRALAFIREMRSLGCRFALDDFGVGVNSLKYLKSLTADRVKIDGSFVMDVLTNNQSAATIRAIVSLAHDLGMETVAECVESSEVIARMRELGVGYVQGFAVHRPHPLGQVLGQLRAAQEARRGWLEREI